MVDDFSAWGRSFFLYPQHRPRKRVNSKRDIAQFVDDQELVAGELTLQAQQTFFIARFVQLVDQGGGSGEADREALLASGQSEPQRDVSLAGAAIADCDDVLAASDV